MIKNNVIFFKVVVFLLGLIFISGQYNNRRKVLLWDRRYHQEWRINYISLGTSQLKPTVCLRYVDDTSIQWPRQEPLQTFFQHMKSVRPSIRFTIKVEKIISYSPP